MAEKNPVNLRKQIGALIGLGCPKCGGYVTVEFLDSHRYQAVCENCDHEYRITFDKEALENAAPRLLAACVTLVGTVLRETDAATIGSPGHKHVNDALTAIAQATGYPPEYYDRLTQEIKRFTQEIRQVPRE